VVASAANFNGHGRSGGRCLDSTKRTLMGVLNSVGKSTRVLTQPDGTDLLLLPYGGRVLGLFALGSQENFYWTNPALASDESARAFYASEQWHNSGGDRTWLAPEVDIFLPNYPDRDKYFQPRELDPGRYQIEDDNGRVRLTNRLTLTLSRSHKRIELELSKSFTPASNPLRYERDTALGPLEYAGYTQHTSLKIVGGDAASSVGLWNLVQMPHGGELLVPTYSRATPKLIFGNIPETDLEPSDRLVRYHMRQAGEHKIALRAVVTTDGWVTYLSRAADGQLSSAIL